MKTTLNFSHHRLTSSSQLKEYITTMGNQAFWAYAERLYCKIVMMHPGEALIIDDVVAEANRDLLIKLLCEFMASGIAQGFHFNATFTEFRRAKLPITQSTNNNLKRKQKCM
ncbi:MAG: hypothetical protein PHW82_14980 [Bacteroidales bacterium]|nr:hypothetical protein [Bacteroidales bacterium]